MPDPALGWSTATLIGQPAELLLAGGIERQRLQSVPRHRTGAAPARLAQAGGRQPAMLAFSAAPLLDAEGRIVGTRGMASTGPSSTTSQGRVAAALRRGEVLDHILWRMGQEVLAPRMMQAALDALMNALGAEGAAVIDRTAPGRRRAGAPGRRRGRRDAGRGDCAAGRPGGGRPMPPARMAGRSWSPPAIRGSARMPALRCGARPARAAGTTRTSC